jgi:hypothetical protein
MPRRPRFPEAGWNKMSSVILSEPKNLQFARASHNTRSERKGANPAARAAGAPARAASTYCSVCTL